MNGRNIPGFYWDADKKKYFKIQPNHRAPAGAKHSVDNVRKEEQSLKRRKVELAWSERVAQQTLHRSPVCQFHHSRIGLGRELGLQSRRQADVARSEVFARSAHAETVKLGGGGDDDGARDARGQQRCIHDYVPIRDGDRFITGVGYGEESAVTLDGRPFDMFEECLLGVETDSISSIGLCDNQVLVATYPDPRWSKLEVVKLDTETLEPAGVSVVWHAQRHWSIHDSVVRPVANDILLLEDSEDFSGRLTCFDLEHHKEKLAWTSPCEVRAADWLSPNTVVTGNMRGMVELHDMRSRSRATRFSNGLGLIGVRAQGDGHGIWTSDREKLCLFDVRMHVDIRRGDDLPLHRSRKLYPKKSRTTSMSVISIRHPYERPKAEMTVWHGTGLLVARDNVGSLDLFSTADGSLVRRISNIGGSTIHKIKSGVDGRGVPELYWSTMTGIRRFKYGDVIKSGEVQDIEVLGSTREDTQR